MRKDETRVLHVSAHGAETDCDFAHPCSLQGAQRRVRALRASGRENIVVDVQAGRYFLPEPLVFAPGDSGESGRAIVWRGPADDSATLDGGVVLDGWREVDAGKHIWHASVPRGTHSLQLFVDGRRAVRARGPGCQSPADCRYSTSGIVGISSRYAGFAHPEDLVAVAAVRWRDFHCPVQAIAGEEIRLRQPCWHNTTIDSVNLWSQASPRGKYFKQIDWLENAYEFLGKPGQFYLDTREDAVYYVPRAGEDMSHAEVIMPVSQALLVLEGAGDRRVHDLRFEHLRFADTTWLAPDSPEGYVGLQAGYLVTGQRDRLPDDGEGMSRIPSAVRVSGGEHVAFAADVFERLGAAGIALVDGTRDSMVTASDFHDLSGGAIFVGDTVSRPPRANGKSGGNVVSRNRIARVAQEYRDNVAIMGGFNDGLTIDHNTISDLPYAGISVGWGWNSEGEGDTQRDVRITRNRITRVMQQLHDGGAIYTQSQSPGSLIAGNYIEYAGYRNGNAIYLDERSRGYRVCANVVWNAGSPVGDMHWLSAWADWSGDLVISGNWSDDPRTALHNPGPTKRYADNHLALIDMPPAARAIVAESGVDGGGEDVVCPAAVPAH
jgi:hypothetical protein